MPGWLTEVLKLLGFTTPFLYAATTYGAFHWLDKKASGPAKRALTARLQSQAPSKETLANFALEVFDRIYTKPLFHWRAFCRSALITIVLCAIVWIETDVLKAFSWDDFDRNLVLSSIVVNICSDYVSIFFIRKLLTAMGRRPALGLVASFVVALMVVYVSHIVRMVGFISFTFWRSETFFSSTIYLLEKRPELLFLSWRISEVGLLTAPALAVHLWLPLLALAIGLAQLFGYFSKAVGWMQWFLKQGQHHPFQAVGLMASVIVFVSSVIIQYVWR
jgi:hypothetical protein